VSRKVIKSSSGDAPRAASSDAKLLVVRDLKTHFLSERGRVRAVDGVSLSLEQGKTLGVVGESGSGKTILSRSIMGLLPKRNVVREGEVLYEGDDIAGYDQNHMRSIWGSEMAMIFQDPMTSLNPVMKIGKQITESLRFHLDMDKGEANDTAVALLSSVGIPEPNQRISEYPHQLSGGMRQRATIALATICRPDFVIADEPTTALDVVVQKDVLAMLRDVQREMQSSVVFVTHDMSVHASIADRVGIMYAGRLVEEAPTRTLFTTPRHPYTAHLVASLPRIGDTTPKAALDGRPPNLADPPTGCRFHPRCPLAVERCTTEVPPLESVGPDHRAACWRAADVEPLVSLGDRATEAV
jgi:peptide/nickel transport system ATP-binding protein